MRDRSFPIAIARIMKRSRPRLLPLLALGLVAACAEPGLRFGDDAAAPVAVPATAEKPALTRPALAADLLGGWQNLALPVELRQPSQPQGALAAPWQWYLFLPDGRFGIVASESAPLGPVTTTDLRAEFESAPHFDFYAMGPTGWDGIPGRLKIEPANAAGYSFRGRQIWQVDLVMNAGRGLGIDLKPGDLVMTLLDSAGAPLYYRALRRIADKAE